MLLSGYKEAGMVFQVQILPVSTTVLQYCCASEIVFISFNSSTHHFPWKKDDVSKENISATNLAGHLKSCKNLPTQYKLEALQNHPNQHTPTLTPAQESLGKMFQSNKPTAGPAIVTPSVFRSTLIQGVVRDNYPLTFGEGEGMRQVFGLVSPELRLPVHSTMRKDLAKLHKVLSKRVQQVLNVSSHLFSFYT
jgi:hypothetical protein